MKMWPTDEKRFTSPCHLAMVLVLHEQSAHMPLPILTVSARRSILGKAEGFLHSFRVFIGAFTVLPVSFIDGNLA